MEFDYIIIFLKRILGMPGESPEPPGTSQDPTETPLGSTGMHLRLLGDPVGTPKDHKHTCIYIYIY